MSENDEKWIPLLSGRRFEDFTPAEFRAHVTGLYHKKELRRALKKEKPPFVWRLNKKGTLIVKVNRDPKWLFQSEAEAIMLETSLGWDIVSKKLLAKKIELRFDPVRTNSDESKTA